MTFTARGSDPNGDALEYIWDLGDDTVVSGSATITHTYEEAGYYRTQVIATDGRGGIDRDQVDVEVAPPPATLNPNVTPDNANWNVYNSFWYDDYYGIDEYGTGNETFQLHSDYHYIIVEADGYYTEYGKVFVVPGETETVSVVLTPISEDPPIEDPPIEDPPIEDPPPSESG